MSTKTVVSTVHLYRDGVSVPWGFRLVGGCDLDAPLSITRVNIGSPSDGPLQKGDIIRKIGNYDARDLRHADALNLFTNAGSNISIVIQREVPIESNNCSSRSSSCLSFLPEPPFSGAVATPFTVAGLPAYERAQQHPINNLNRFPPALLDVNGDRHSSKSPHQFEVDQETQIVTEQPYRTTPLVLPGAKVSKDPAPTMSYLRHHPNPAMRSGPPQYEWVPVDIAKKQQLADSMLERAIGNDLKTGKKIIKKQFNSPIGLYSEQNIANSVTSQTNNLTPNGGTPNYNQQNSRFRKTVVYDPSKSETYKALHEAELGDHVQEVTTPVTPRVFSPVKTPTKKLSAPSNYNPNRASPQPHHTAPHPKADYGVPPEEIHQSNSFKRLMTMVMTDSNY